MPSDPEPGYYFACVPDMGHEHRHPGVSIHVPLGVDVHEMCENFRAFLLALGYHSDSIDRGLEGAIEHFETEPSP